MVSTHASIETKTEIKMSSPVLSGKIKNNVTPTNNPRAILILSFHFNLPKRTKAFFNFSTIFPPFFVKLRKITIA